MTASSSGGSAISRVAVADRSSDYEVQGKLYRVSQPYASGGTPIWTTYAYDGRMEAGRHGEPGAGAGAEPGQDTTVDGRYLKTDYTYNAIGQMTQVFMRRYPVGSTSTYTDQTRTFAYSGANLTSATNPETGTVTYEYDNDGHVTKKTDAKGWETRYSYDTYGRLTQVQHWAWQNSTTLVEQADQRIDYYYDSNPCSGSFSTNATGRLAAVNFKIGSEDQGCVYQFAYNQAGRVTSQKMTWKLSDGSQGSSGPAAFDLTAGYEWDNEGRMTAMTYPEVGTAGKRYTYGFDAMGRTNAMVDTSDSNTVVSATFGVAGEIASLGYFGRGESRTYNNLLQMTRQTVTYSGSTWLDNQYVYTSGANNGRIAQMIDGVTGETIDYTYDVWNRLTKAETEGTTGVQWGQSFTYDGFGNLYAKSQTKGSAPSFNVNINPATNGGPTSYSHEIPDGSMDVEWRPLGSSTVRYFYDQAGKRVMTRTDAYGWPNYPYSATYEVAMYGLGGQRMVTANCSYDGQARPGCGVGGANNMYFGGKLVMSRGVIVATDRLGSVRRNGNGESFAYYPYGEERTSTSDGREKFGTYVRDSATQDYADQRYYGVGTGRFNVPDPYQASAGAVSPRSWNRFAYAEGDPINARDPKGLFATVTLDGIDITDYWGYRTDCDRMETKFAPMAGPCSYSDVWIPYDPADEPAAALQCSVTLMTTDVDFGGDPLQHVVLRMTVTDPNSGVSQTGYLEGVATSKGSGKKATITDVIFGTAWLNKSLDVTWQTNQPPRPLWNFDGEDLCGSITAMGAAYNRYTNNTITYNLSGPNSNTFAHYIVNEGNLNVPGWLNSVLVFIAPGWGSSTAIFH